jgi:hypothetical protein
VAATFYSKKISVSERDVQLKGNSLSLSLARHTSAFQMYLACKNFHFNNEHIPFCQQQEAGQSIL